MENGTIKLVLKVKLNNQVIQLQLHSWENIDGLKSLVNKICNNYKLPYFTFSPTFSICKTHGYINGEHFKCPHCNAITEVYSRVVGYLRPVQQWNDGKRAEFDIRKTFKMAE